MIEIGVYVVLVQSEVFRDRLAKLSFKSHYLSADTHLDTPVSKD